MVLKIVSILFVVGLLVELLPGLSVTPEDHNLRAQEKMGVCPKLRIFKCRELFILAVRNRNES